MSTSSDAFGSGEPSVRGRLVSAAVDVFAEQGYDRTRVQDVAKRAGLSTGAIYGNFRDKADLLAEVIDVVMADSGAAIAAARRAGASAVELIEMMGAGLAEPTPATSAGRRVVAEAFAAARRDEEARRRVAAALLRSESELTGIVEKARRDGSLADDIPTDALVRLLLAIGVGYAELESAGAPDPDRLAWHQVIHRMLGGFRTEQPPVG